MTGPDAEDRDLSSHKTHTVRVFDGDDWHRLMCEPGANLRVLLLKNDLSPYVPLTEKLNCGGRGLCATCGVRFDGEAPAPQHWHDKAAARFGYPRLSCQISVERDLVVRLLPEKLVWGKREQGMGERETGGK